MAIHQAAVATISKGVMKLENNYDRIAECIKSLGHHVLDKEYQKNVNEWLSWYKGELDSFHKYKLYNGFHFINKKRASLRMPKRVAEEWASLLYNDKVCITVSDADQRALDNILSDNRFNYKFSELIERTFALGTGATVVFADAQGNPKIDYIVAPMIFPLKQENGEIVDCAFGRVKGEALYINIHVKNDDGSYTVINHMYAKSNKGYESVKLEGITQSAVYPVKMFQIYKPNIANNIDLFTPYGMSIYANAIEQNKVIDITYDSLKNEFELGRKRLFLALDVLTSKPITNEKGETFEVPVFDEEQTEFFALPDSNGNQDKLIAEINPQLRITEHIDALQTVMNIFADTCGFGPDRFVFRDGKVYTNADQVISTQSKLYKNIVNHEKVLRYSMIELIKAVLYVANGSEYINDVTIDFDDSIIEDSEKTRNQALLELNNQLIDDVQYYIDVYKMTEEQAIEFRDKISERSPQEEEIEEEPPEGA